jgi:hypothetical protein
VTAKPKKIPLKNLSKIPPTHEEFTQVLNVLKTQTAPPIALAILSATMVEQELEAHLRRRFPKIKDDEWFEILSDQGALGTFSRKIQLGFAFRIFDRVTCKNLDTIRRIRNAFAHSKKLLEFDHESIVDELKKISMRNARMQKRYNKSWQGKNPARYVYMFLWMDTLLSLQRKRNRVLSAWHRRQQQRTNSLAAALMQYLPPASQGSGPLSSLPPQTGDPTASTRLGLLAGMFDPPPRSESKKSK